MRKQCRLEEFINESFKTLSVITTKNKADNRVDSTVPDRPIVAGVIV